MTRLTNDIRDTIVFNATKKSFISQNETMSKEENLLALELYNSLFDKKELTIIKKLDKKWFHYDTCLRFNCGGYDLRLCVKEGVPVPYDKGYCSRLGNINGELAEKAQVFANKKKDSEQQQQKTARTVKSLLFSVNTIKQLKTVWPEGSEFYSMYDEQSSKSIGGLPAVQIEEINSILGLKASKKKEAA